LDGERVARHVADFVRVPAADGLMALAVTLAPKGKVAVHASRGTAAWWRCFTDNWALRKAESDVAALALTVF
jgi:hypothetical protein